GFTKVVQNNRIKSGNKAGGQPGHEGTTLPLVEHPDKRIEYKVETCGHCGTDLVAIEAKHQRRQVYDIPQVKIEVTEHRLEVKKCPVCSHHTVAVCEVPASVQYGKGIKSLAVYL